MLGESGRSDLLLFGQHTVTPASHRLRASFQPEHFQLLRMVEDRHFWFVARREIVLHALRRFAPYDAELNVLEIGCGTGNVLRFFQQSTRWRLTGMDVHAPALEICRQDSNIPLVVASAVDLPFGQWWDLVGLFDVLEHIDDDQAVLDACRATLRRGGRLVLTVPAFPFLWSSFDVTACHRRRYKRENLVASLRRAGFEIERATYFMCALLPLVYAFRKLRDHFGRKSASSSDLPFEVRMPKVANGPLLALLRVEGRMLERFDLPCGVSLLVVARVL